MDRNGILLTLIIGFLESLSARRAWIEIIEDLEPSSTRKLSLSARRAWIEILITLHETLNLTVALRKESVDRNHYNLNLPSRPIGRSPQGERG